MIFLGVGAQTQAVCLYHPTCQYTLHACFSHGGWEILEQSLELFVNHFAYLSISIYLYLSLHLSIFQTLSV